MLVHNGWFLNQNSPYGSGAWFLDVLVLLYIIFYIIKRIAGKRNELYIFLCSLMVIIGWYFSNQPADFMFCYEKSARGYLTFFIGVLMYELYVRIGEENGKKFSYLLCSVDLVIFFVSGLYGLLTHENVFGSFRLFMSVYIIPSVLFSSISLLSELKFLLSARIVKYMTSVYIWHALVLAEIELIRINMGYKWDYSNWLTFSIVMLIIALQCVIAYYLIEKRMTKYLNKKIVNSFTFVEMERSQV